jgi:hypothetical protein
MHFILSPMRATFSTHLILSDFILPNNIRSSLQIVRLFAVQLSQYTFLCSPCLVYIFSSPSTPTLAVWETRLRFQTVPVKLCFLYITFLGRTFFSIFVTRVSRFPNINLCGPKVHRQITNNPRLNAVLIHITPHLHTLFLYLF